jgi:hypothetical protein
LFTPAAEFCALLFPVVFALFALFAAPGFSGSAPVALPVPTCGVPSPIPGATPGNVLVDVPLPFTPVSSEPFVGVVLPITDPELGFTAPLLSVWDEFAGALLVPFAGAADAG